MYHALEDSDHPAGAKDPGEQLYVLETEQFREQMEYLHREGYRTFLLEELQALAEWPDKAVVLTFDDGHESNFTLALPILQEYGFKAEFFITTGWIGTPYFINEEQIRELHRAGMGIGSHGVTHAFISDLGGADVVFELAESQKVLTELTGQSIESFSAPGGRTSDRVIAAARKCGYSILCTSQFGRLEDGRLLPNIPRIPIRAATSLSEFAALVAGDAALTARMVSKDRLLAIVKVVLGNLLYEKVRSVFLRQEVQTGNVVESVEEKRA